MRFDYGGWGEGGRGGGEAGKGGFIGVLRRKFIFWSCERGFWGGAVGPEMPFR